MADAKSPRRRVLSVGSVPELLASREAVLQSEGYEVITTMKLQEAVAHLRASNCAVLVVCHSFPEDARNALIHEYQKFCPRGRVAGISNMPVTHFPKDVDALVYGVEGPEVLMDAIAGKAA